MILKYWWVPIVLVSILFLYKKRRASYTFRIINNTEYHLSEVDFSFCQRDQNPLSIPPHKFVDIQLVDKNWMNFITHGSICYAVKTYEKGGVVKEHNSGGVYPANELTQDTVNTFVIEENNQETKFDFKCKTSPL